MTYSKHIRIEYTRDVAEYLGHLENCDDEVTVEQLIGGLAEVIEPKGMENTDYRLALVYVNTKQDVPQDWNVGMLRTYDHGTFEFRMFVRISIAVTPFRI